jgi:uncharacterized protein YceK
MKRNHSAMAAICVVAVLTLSGCSTVRSWWGDTRADGAAMKQDSGQQGYGSRAEAYRPMEVHEPR